MCKSRNVSSEINVCLTFEELFVHGGFIILYFYQQWKRIPVSLQPHQYLSFHIFMCMSVCLHLLQSLKAREGIGSTIARIMGGCKMSCWHWERNLGFLQEQPMLFTLSLYSGPVYYCCCSWSPLCSAFPLWFWLAFPADSDVNPLFMCSFAVCVWFIEPCLFKFFAWFLIISLMLVIKVLHVSRICIHIRRMICKNARDFF